MHCIVFSFCIAIVCIYVFTHAYMCVCVRFHLQESRLLPQCYVVLRIDGRSFSKFTQDHSFHKPVDIRGCRLMDKAAAHVMRKSYCTPHRPLDYISESYLMPNIIHMLTCAAHGSKVFSRISHVPTVTLMSTVLCSIRR